MGGSATSARVREEIEGETKSAKVRAWYTKPSVPILI